MDTPIKDMLVAILSNIEYCLVAEIIPIDTPTITEIATLSVAKSIVVGNLSKISSITGFLDA
ncbi:hypothetical protein SDC9_113704 [bioreactor metagenome]|uniref:Uncharacterized protein n=1 Tax=bioreactor metagenome TaxID=1076179 RepID=A0A645BU81_9ZZZZ